jgi:serine/threonine-protein kinase HipA
MRFANALGLDVAQVETTQIGNRKVLVVERYDRIVAPDGAVRRLHQEDLCQATGQV